jgi:hypothetical protein
MSETPVVDARLDKLEQDNRRLKLTVGAVLMVLAALTLSFALISCAGVPNEDVEGTGNSGAALDVGQGEESGEHAGTGDHSGPEGADEHGAFEGGEEGEVSGTYIARNETWDRTRRGARLVLTFNASRNTFVGTVENTTEQMLCAVRVEVHLDDGTELGPTARTDVQSKGTIDVELPTEGEGFDTWTAHPELSPCGFGS